MGEKYSNEVLRKVAEMLLEDTVLLGLKKAYDSQEEFDEDDCDGKCGSDCPGCDFSSDEDNEDDSNTDQTQTVVFISADHMKHDIAYMNTMLAMGWKLQDVITLNEKYSLAVLVKE